MLPPAVVKATQSITGSATMSPGGRKRNVGSTDTASIIESYAEPNPLETGLEYTDEEILQRVRRDQRYGLDLVYRVKLKEKKEPIRIVAPFVSCSLHPKYKPVGAMYESETEIKRTRFALPAINQAVELVSDNPNSVENTRGLNLFGSQPKNAMPNFMRNHLSLQ